MSNTASLKNEYKERIVPALIEQFGLSVSHAGARPEEDRHQPGPRYGYG